MDAATIPLAHCATFARRAIGAFILMASLAVAAIGTAEDARADQTSFILTITGNIDTARYPDGAAYHRDALLALGLEKLETETPFTKGLQQFEGVRLSVVLDAVGARGSILTATALDGYSIDMPFEDAARYNVFLALKWNGEVMKVRNKGPIWIVYPISQFPDVNTEVYSARSVWQLKSITVK